jgi:transposase
MEVLMEACGMSHHWGRELEALGHSVRLLPPSDVARYRDGNKTDRADALALLEASRNERIDDVPVKTVEQQALVALVGDPMRFPSPRHFAFYLGLIPRESSSGLRRRLGRISKRGNRYLRMLLIHGARAALLAAHRTVQPDTLQQWALGVEARIGHNQAAVALANRLGRP